MENKLCKSFPGNLKKTCTNVQFECISYLCVGFLLSKELAINFSSSINFIIFFHCLWLREKIVPPLISTIHSSIHSSIPPLQSVQDSFPNTSTSFRTFFMVSNLKIWSKELNSRMLTVMFVNWHLPTTIKISKLPWSDTSFG